MGGVAIYVRNSLNFISRHELVPSSIEAVCVEIKKPNCKPFIICSVYRPPNSPTEFFDKYDALLQNIDRENKEIYILGDLNCNFADNRSNPSTKSLKLLNRLYQLKQIIDDPTHITSSTSSLIYRTDGTTWSPK